MKITPLGSGQEVGRSCHLLEFRGLNILLDCGIHPGYEGLNGLPYFDQLEPSEVDLILVTHFHLDHAASLPYFTERTGFKGRIFMTHPTKAVMRLLLGDYMRLMEMNAARNAAANKSNTSENDVLFTADELKRCLEKVELVDYHQVVQVAVTNKNRDSQKQNAVVKFYALNAGHVLGAAMFFIEIAGHTVLYTGDYSMEDDRHLMAAELPPVDVRTDVLIVESTYGVQVHASRQEREMRFTSTIERVVSRGGRCLIPVFALGRAQELLLILDEYWQANPHLQNIPIWYASNLANKALRVYRTYVNMMNARLRAQMDMSNPFSFKHIKSLKDHNNNLDDRNPAVVFASPGMLQSGVSRQLFDRWCTDSKNGVLIAGYAVDHTLAKEIMLQPKEVVSLEGRRQPLNCLVDYVSFSAHVDFMQNRNFINQVKPRHIVLVHGAKEEMGRLKSALMLQYKQIPENKRPTVSMPPNTTSVKLLFDRRRSAKVIGSLAEQRNSSSRMLMPPQKGDNVQGILLTQNFHSKIVSKNELAKYSQLRVGSVRSRLHVPCVGKSDTLRLFLNEMFHGIDEVTDNRNRTEFRLHDEQVKVILGEVERTAIVEWDANPVCDMLSDAVIALIMHAQGSAASIRLTGSPCCGKKKVKKEDGIGSDLPNKKTRSDDGNRPSDDSDIILNRFESVHTFLNEQFDNVKMELDFSESLSAIFYVYGDLPSDAPTDEGKNSSLSLPVTCTVKLEFENKLGINAKLNVSGESEKIVSNIRSSLKHFVDGAGPITI